MLTSPPFHHPRYTPLQALLEAPARGVWKMYDRLLKQPVALKAQRISPDLPSADRLSHEYKWLRRLGHPSLPAALELGWAHDPAGDPPWRFLTTAWMEGPDLPTVASQLDEAGTQALARWLLMTLGYLHLHGLMHLDLKPEHILRHRGRWCLLDALELAGEPRSAGPVVGTLDWLAPEVMASGQRSVRGDLFSAGQVLASVDAMHSATLQPLLLALLEHDPHKRPASAEQALVLLPPSPHNVRQALPPLVPPTVGPVDVQQLCRWLAEQAASGGVLELMTADEVGGKRLLLELSMAW